MASDGFVCLHYPACPERGEIQSHSNKEVAPMNSRRVLPALFVGLVLLLVPQISIAKDPPPPIVKTASSGFYSNEKITIGSIEGWDEAVDILKGSLNASLLNMYTKDERDAFYTISGNIFAKKHWRKGRIYVYHTVNLTITNGQGDVVMSIRSSEPFWQTDLNKFTDVIADSLKNAMKDAPERPKLAQRETVAPPKSHSVEIPTCDDSQVVDVFRLSDKEQIRICLIPFDGRMYSRASSTTYVATEKRMCIPTELFPRLEKAMARVEQRME
jgi:hypothetical protein